MGFRRRSPCQAYLPFSPNTVHLMILTWILGRPVRPWMRLRTGKLLIFLFTALGLQRPRLEDTRSSKISSKTVS